ncbi:hypothetical protein [Elizabethkingia meningoseptica]|uniref:hypothetical protein n=1 Tax=Elizabethkingia meningoseptica TaxID=238 RepID=UPI002DD6506C|nr:hypothetical protein [Elizabethkingia meningoseptica]MEC4711060.1 hypothetical protein [Elizabethkingia meningoseptica]
MKELIDWFKTNDFISFIKDYLSLILFFGTALGWLKQFLVLVTLSTGFLKFFSLSQMAIDGTEVIVMSPFMLIGLFLYLAKKGEKYPVKGLLILISFSLLVIIGLFLGSKDYNGALEIGRLIAINFLVIYLYNDSVKKEYLKTKKQKIFYIIPIALFFSILTSLFPRIDSRIENIETVEKKYGAKFLYCNDKYLFFERINDQNVPTRLYFVKEFKELFSE